MANDNVSQQAAILAATTIVARNQERAMQGVLSQYNRRQVHTVGGTNETRAAKKEQYIAERRHQNELDHEKELFDLTEQRIKLEKEGNKELAKQMQERIRAHRIKGPEEIGFDDDELTKNFSSTLEEIATNFSDLDRGEQKAEIERLKALYELIDKSNAKDKNFLLQQTADLMQTAQNEYDKRASLAARALEKSAEMAEQYMDISSLYAGFVDHNPVMMALWRIGGDFIKRWRTQKKAQREAIARDHKNAAEAEKQNIQNKLRAEEEARRAEELSTAKQATMDLEQKAAEEQKALVAEQKAAQKESEKAERAPAKEKVKREETVPAEGGDAPIEMDFMREVFGDTDEDGDAVNLDFLPDSGEKRAIEIDDTEPLQVAVKEDSPEQKSRDLFVRQDEESRARETKEYQLEDVQRQEKIFEKLVDIEDAIKHGHKLSMKKKDGGGLLSNLGGLLGRFLGPIGTALGGILTALGMGGLANKLTGGVGGGAGGASKGAGAAKKGGAFKRMGGMARGAGALLGRLGWVGAAGAAGWEVGTLLNDHVLPDSFKERLGDFLGLGVDQIAANVFGSEDAAERIKLYEQYQGRSASTLGLTKLDKPTDTEKEKGAAFAKDAGNGRQIVINADKIESTKIIRGQPNYEVPIQERTQERMQQLERKIGEVEEAKMEAERRQAAAIAVPVPTTQKVVQATPSATPAPVQRSARNNDSSISRNTDRMVSYGMG